ncbi:MAG TPA: VOC family protein [Fimbriimonadaceae bacterium]|nr:VOC family protein [Fimbriimonadaceae bacterium]
MDLQIGQMPWRDIAVDDADSLRDFYAAVVGWTWRGESMGDYEDYSMIPPGGTDPVAGICHRRGPNAQLPAQWLVYIVVEDLDASLAEVRRLGGTVLEEPRTMGSSRFACIQDPAGAVCALYQP